MTTTPTPKTEDKPQPTTGPRSGKTTNRKTNPKDGGHTLTRITGPYATKSGRFEVTFRCECGFSARPYVKDDADLDSARKAHARHLAKATATTTE